MGRRRLALSLALALGALSAGCDPSGPPPEVVDLAGLQRWLHAKRPAPILVNFWGTWCAPCCEEMPDLVAGTRAFRASGGVVVGVAMETMVPGVTIEQAVAKVTERAPQLGIDFPVLVCSESDFFAVRKALGVDLGSLPLTMALDRHGKFVELHEGKADRTEFAALAAAAMK